jgi:hypothetical protein
MKKKPKYWRHTGGGCGLTTSSRHPCDESYERGSERVTVLTTFDRHWNMPERVVSLSQLKRLKGVGTIKKEK